MASLEEGEVESTGFIPHGAARAPVPLDAEVGSLGRVGDGSRDATWRNFICLSSHPVAAFFHVCFKVASILLYVFGSRTGMEYVSIFVSIVLLLAADFWTVKNITGRLLVGLRWWIKPAETPEGKSEWIFESAPLSRVDSLDRRIFWWSLYATTLTWSIFGIIAFVVLSFDWLLVDIVAMGLSGTNLMGYFKCSQDAQKRLQATLASTAMTGLSYIPGALPALGSTMMNIFSAARASQAAPAPPAPAARV
jgi:hypothetical protein